MSSYSVKYRLKLILRRFGRLHRFAKRAKVALYVARDHEKGLLLAVRYGSRLRVGPPRGHFSAYEGLKNGTFEGRVVAESQTMPEVPAHSICNLAGMNQCGEQPWPIFGLITGMLGWSGLR